MGGSQPVPVSIVAGQDLGFSHVGDVANGGVEGIGNFHGVEPAVPGAGGDGFVVDKHPNFGVRGFVAHGTGPEGAEDVGPEHGKGAALRNGVGASELGAQVSSKFEAGLQVHIK